MQDLPLASLETITGGETLLILAPSPGDESLGCGGLIARCCSLGRQPFVMVLGDGTASHPQSRAWPADRLALLHERETRAAVACLGLRPERLLMAGIYDGAIPEEGPLFAAVVRAVTLVMWARDCNTICAPWPHGSDPADRAAHRIAAAVAAESGVGHIAYGNRHARLPAEAEGWRFGIAQQMPAKREAIAAHAALRGGVVVDEPAPPVWPASLVEAALLGEEIYLRPAA